MSLAGKPPPRHKCDQGKPTGRARLRSLRPPAPPRRTCRSAGTSQTRMSRVDCPAASGKRLRTTASGCAGSDVRAARDNVVSPDVIEGAPRFAAPFRRPPLDCGVRRSLSVSGALAHRPQDGSPATTNSHAAASVELGSGMAIPLSPPVDARRVGAPRATGQMRNDCKRCPPRRHGRVQAVGAPRSCAPPAAQMPLPVTANFMSEYGS